MTVIALIVGVLGCIFGLIAIVGAYDDRPPRRGQVVSSTATIPPVADRPTPPELTERVPRIAVRIADLDKPGEVARLIAERMAGHVQRRAMPEIVYVDDPHDWVPPPGPTPTEGYLLIPKALRRGWPPPRPYDYDDQRLWLDAIVGFPGDPEKMG